jgi:hypothetical protein
MQSLLQCNQNNEVNPELTLTLMLLHLTKKYIKLEIESAPCPQFLNAIRGSLQNRQILERIHSPINDSLSIRL